MIIPSQITLSDSALVFSKEYLTYLQNRYLIYQIYVEQNQDLTTILITYLRFRELIKIEKVFGYLYVEGKLFLIYLGQNTIFKTPIEFQRILEEEINKRKIPAIFSDEHSSFDYGYLEIRSSQESGTFKKKYIWERLYGFPSPPPPKRIISTIRMGSFSEERKGATASRQ